MGNLPQIELRRLDSKGRLLVPANIREALKWSESDLISIEPFTVKDKVKLVLSNASQDHVSIEKRIREDLP